MAVFTCGGAGFMNDLIDKTQTACGGWVASATSTNAFDQSELQLKSSELNGGVGGFRSCAVYSQASFIQAQWVGTATYTCAASCVGSAANFTTTACAITCSLIVGGEFTKIPVSQNDSIQFTIQLSIT